MLSEEASQFLDKKIRATKRNIEQGAKKVEEWRTELSHYMQLRDETRASRRSYSNKKRARSESAETLLLPSLQGVMEHDPSNAATDNGIGPAEPRIVRRVAAVRIPRRPHSSQLSQAPHEIQTEERAMKGTRYQVCKIPAEDVGLRVPWTSLVTECDDILYWLRCCYCKVNATWFKGDLPHSLELLKGPRGIKKHIQNAHGDLLKRDLPGEADIDEWILERCSFKALNGEQRDAYYQALQGYAGQIPCEYVIITDDAFQRAYGSGSSSKSVSTKRARQEIPTLLQAKNTSSANLDAEFLPSQDFTLFPSSQTFASTTERQEKEELQDEVTWLLNPASRVTGKSSQSSSKGRSTESPSNYSE